MPGSTILTLDLNFQNTPGAIGVYLVPHREGCLLIETGPSSTLHTLIHSLEQYGFNPSDVTDVLLTHIHLDHAGSAGWWARQGARIHVHQNGIPHLVNPEKLLSSAALVFGKQMDTLWGEYLPVPAEQINCLTDDIMIHIGGVNCRALDVPGHASHHLAYLIDEVCFTGDIGGVRVQNQRYISLPMPPPDLNINQWRASIHKLVKLQPQVIIPTHFGKYYDPEWHFGEVLQLLTDVELWIEAYMPRNLSPETFREEFIRFETERARQAGIDERTIVTQHIANPPSMAVDGIMRFWKKYSPRNAQNI